MYALHHANHVPNYCLTDDVPRDRHSTLLKLHGSVNWARCGKCRSAVPWHLGSYFKKNRYHVFEQPTTAKISSGSQLDESGLQCCGTSVEPYPAIIPPTWNKTQYHSAILPVWRRAAVELSNAENIFVAGYSLPESDLFFKYLLALGMVGDRRIKRFWVFDVDSTGKVEARFRQLLGGDVRGRFKYFNSGFESMAHALGQAFL